MKVVCTKVGKWKRIHDANRWRDIVPFDKLPKPGEVYEVESKAKIAEGHEVVFLVGFPLGVGFNAMWFKEVEVETSKEVYQ